VTNRVKVTVKDHGFNRAKTLLRQPRKVLSVGVHPSEALQPHPSKAGVTVGDVAVWMEYGTDDGHVPARSWLFDWVDQEADVISRQLATDTMRVLFGQPPEDEAVALGKRGTVYRRQIIDRIRYENPFVSNAPATIKKKGFDLPLIDSETFIESIRWEVK
jgi:hypothetical protein